MLDKIKNKFYTALTAGALLVGSYFIGCKDEIVQPIIENQKPTASYIASPDSGNAPLNVEFDGSASKDNDGTIEKYFWYFGDGNIDSTSGVKVNYNYNNPGNYQSGLEVEDNQWKRSEKALENIAVGKAPNKTPIASFTATPKSGYFPLIVNFNGSSSYDEDGNISKWYWDFDNNGIVDDSSGSNVSHTYQTKGNYQAGLEVKDNEGKKSDKKLENILVMEKPNQIAFWSNRTPLEGGYNEDIYKADLVKNSGGKDTLVNIKRLTNNSNQDLEPSWSPDGKYILFTSHRTGGTAVWKMDENGNNQTDITSSLVERARRAHWHSNGKIVVAYTDKNSTEAGIGTINPEGTSFTPIYSVPARSDVPTSPNPSWSKWSLDGTKIAFVEYDGDEEIYVMNANGTGLENLTNNNFHDTQPYWLSNTEILFMSDRDNGNLDIYKINVNTKEVTRLTNDSGHDLDAVSSSNGSKIIFVHDLASFFTPNLYSMDVDGTNWVQLTFEGANRYPAWRPNN